MLEDVGRKIRTRSSFDEDDHNGYYDNDLPAQYLTRDNILNTQLACPMCKQQIKVKENKKMKQVFITAGGCKYKIQILSFK